MTPGSAAVATRPQGWVDPETLRSTTVELEPGVDVDPFALACGAPGTGPGVVVASGDLVLAGHGVAARLLLGRGIAGAGVGTVRRWLEAVPGGGAVCFGALPFSPDEPAALVVPAVLYGRSARRHWVTVVTTGVDADPVARLGALAAEAGGTRRAPARCTGVSGPPGSSFTDGVRSVLEAIAHGRVTKVVLARRVEADFDGPIDVSGVLHRLRAVEPTATVYGIVDPAGSFVGASPELLVSRHGTRVTSRPLAGTVGLTGDEAADEAAVSRLVSSPKETDEHGQVVDAIVDALGPLCAGSPDRSGPTVARLGTVAHLASRVTGTLAGAGTGATARRGASGGTAGDAAEPRAEPADVLALVGALHPTPAVAGTPTGAAMALLDALEPVGRGPYAGAVGWMDAGGDGEFFVAIRGATIRGAHASVSAGAGIVAGSDPERELAETALKLRTALSALGPPPPSDLD